MPPPIAGYMREALLRLGLAIQDQTTITEVRATEVLAVNGVTIPYDVCLWSGGFNLPLLAREAGLTVTTRGQIMIDPYYGAGDIPALSGRRARSDPLAGRLSHHRDNAAVSQPTCVGAGQA